MVNAWVFHTGRLRVPTLHMPRGAVFTRGTSAVVRDATGRRAADHGPKLTGEAGSLAWPGANRAREPGLITRGSSLLKRPQLRFEVTGPHPAGKRDPEDRPHDRARRELPDAEQAERHQ